MNNSYLRKRRRRRYLLRLTRLVASKTDLSRTEARRSLLALEAGGGIEIDAEHKRVLILEEEAKEREDVKALVEADPAQSSAAEEVENEF